LGSNGLYMRSGKETALKKIGKAQPQDLGIWSNREMWTPCYKVNVAGTTGSGDVTIAGFLSAFLHGMNPEQALLSAVAVGACSVEAPNSLNGLITWDETQLRIQKGWERLPATMDVCGWSCENNYDVWQSSAKKLVR
jgi:sugar/nucleoside kinase (ribokinase family)